MQKLLTLIMGERASGERIAQPKFKTTYPTNRLSESEWIREVNFGHRYGTRGSFYQNKFEHIVAWKG